jgi:hypothetical protein
MLMEDWEVTRWEIASAVRENFRTKSQRRRTVHNLKKEQVDLFLESARRKLKRALLMQQSPEAQIEEMMRQADLAADQMARIVKESERHIRECQEPAPHAKDSIHKSQPKSMFANSA